MPAAPGVLPITLLNGSVVCPVCGEDLEKLYWGPQTSGMPTTQINSTFINPNTGLPVTRSVSNTCGSSNSVATLDPTNIQVTGNRIFANINLRGVNPGGGVPGAMSAVNQFGASPNYRIDHNEISGGGECLSAVQRATLASGAYFIVENNFFHDCGVESCGVAIPPLPAETVAQCNDRGGAIDIGENFRTTNDPRGRSNGITVRDNDYANNFANRIPTVPPKTLTDVFIGLGSFGNTIQEDCSVIIYDRGTGNFITPPIGAGCH